MALYGLYLMGAAMLVAAGGLKAFRPADTARAVASAVLILPPRAWPPVVRALAAAEAVLGVVGILFPGRVVAALIAASYLGFTAWVLWARTHGGALATCGCFGKPDTPPTGPHAAVTALAAAGSLAMAVVGPTGWLGSQLAGQYHDGVPLVLAVLVACWLAYLVMVPLARLAALRAAQPYIPGGRS